MLPPPTSRRWGVSRRRRARRRKAQGSQEKVAGPAWGKGIEVEMDLIAAFEVGELGFLRWKCEGHHAFQHGHVARVGPMAPSNVA